MWHNSWYEHVSNSDWLPRHNCWKWRAPTLQVGGYTRGIAGSHFGRCCRHKQTRSPTLTNNTRTSDTIYKVHWCWRWDFFLTFVVNCNRFVIPALTSLSFQHRIQINPLALEMDIYSLAHHLCKMWIFYEPRMVTLGNTWILWRNKRRWWKSKKIIK